MTSQDNQESMPLNGEMLLESKVQQLLSGIDACLAANLWEPTLILLYAGIDAMAWLDRPDGQLDVTGTDFVKWVEKYLLSTPSPQLLARPGEDQRDGLSGKRRSLRPHLRRLPITFD